jgi:hypothetical protein
VPNTDPNKYSPAQEAADAVKGFQPGQLIQAQTKTDKNIIAIESISSWSPRPGEDQPHGYVLIQSGATDKPGDLQITLSKFGEPLQVIVPAENDSQGSPAPNPAIEAELKQVHEGDVVWADLTAGPTPTIAAIVPWSEPLQGKLLRVGPADVDGQKGFAVEITTDQKPITALIPMKLQNGKWLSDPRLLAAAHKPSRGADILFRVREEGAKTWLLDIEPPPKPAAPVAQRQPNPPPAGIPVHTTGGAGSIPGVGGLPGGF